MERYITEVSLQDKLEVSQRSSECRSPAGEIVEPATAHHECETSSADCPRLLEETLAKHNTAYRTVSKNPSPYEEEPPLIQTIATGRETFHRRLD